MSISADSDGKQEGIPIEPSFAKLERKVDDRSDNILEVFPIAGLFDKNIGSVLKGQFLIVFCSGIGIDGDRQVLEGFVRPDFLETVDAPHFRKMDFQKYDAGKLYFGIVEVFHNIFTGMKA